MNNEVECSPHSFVPQIERDATIQSVAADPLTHIEEINGQPVAVLNPDAMALAWGDPNDVVITPKQIDARAKAEWALRVVTEEIESDGEVISATAES